MDILNNLLDEDETILWKRETKKNAIPDQIKFEQDRKREILKIITILTGIVIIFTFLAFLLHSLFILMFLPLSAFILLFFNVKSNFKHATKIYETLSMYHPDQVLQSYPFLDVITNKHFIHIESYDKDYPLWFGHDISYVYEFRNEFRFLNIERLTDICKDIKPKKERYNLGFYFDLPEYNLFGDDAPNQWLSDLTEQEYLRILEILSKLTPWAKISYLFKKQEQLESIPKK